MDTWIVAIYIIMGGEYEYGEHIDQCLLLHFFVELCY